MKRSGVPSADPMEILALADASFADVAARKIE
jgi:hypothetical protein